MSKSIKRFVRLEKARIRREVFDLKKQEEFILELYKKVGMVKNEN